MDSTLPNNKEMPNNVGTLIIPSLEGGSVIESSGTTGVSPGVRGKIPGVRDEFPEVINMYIYCYKY
jgi:hypothetical protein